MKLMERIAAVMGFRSLPNTILLLVLYVIILASVLVTDELPNVPKEQQRHGLDLEQAMQDLHFITARPHPYNSHSNDEVRAYLLSRIRTILSTATNLNTTSASTGTPSSPFSSFGQPPYAHLASDLSSNGSWSTAPYGVYFEGTNLLVKIDGTDRRLQNTGGVLFSAHYDSVSTAPGATDDGMGVVVLLQLMRWFASEEGRPRRSVVFNVNNGEEDWLNGAHAFLQHPWSEITDTFLNLEGAASGGRPILFRATSKTPLKAFHIPHPHANVLSADAFARGVIRSGTDYSVYTTPRSATEPGAGPGPRMHGLDLAFYKGRARYHTKYDAIPWMEGGKKALWAMMETAWGAGEKLANSKRRDWEYRGDVEGTGQKAVYFDLFGSSLVVFSLKGLMVFNIVMLIVGPIFLGLVILCFSVVQPPAEHRHEREREHEHEHEHEHHDHDYYQNGSIHEHEEGMLRRTWSAFQERKWVAAFWRWGKFWVAVDLGVLAQALLIAIYVSLNPFIIYSQPYLVLSSSILLTYLTHSLFLTLPNPKSSQHISADQEKQITLWQIYILSWVLLLLSTLAIIKAEVGGLYIVTAWNVLVALACVVGCVQQAFAPHHGSDADGHGHGHGEGREHEETRPRRGVRFQQDESGADHGGSDDEQEGYDTRGAGSSSNAGRAGGANETTPLIPGQRRAGGLRHDGKDGGGEKCANEDGAMGWWIAQMLLIVPIPLILIAHIGVIVVDAMSQTLADGSSAVIVYSAFAMLAFFMVLPITPFAQRVHKGVTILFALVFAGITLYAWNVFPFSPEIPLKVFFQQKVKIDIGLDLQAVHSTSFSTLHAVNGTPTMHMGAKAVTALTGTKHFLKKEIIPKLPSAVKKDVDCNPDSAKIGLYTCEWETKLMPSPGDGVNRILSSISASNDGNDGDAGSLDSGWIKAEVTRLGKNAARFTIAGQNTRSCRLYFDNRRVMKYRVDGGREGMQPGYEVGQEGLKEVRLWSRSWGREFVVDVEWREEVGAGDGKVKGRVACEWAEFESGSVGGGWTGGKIPALEEVLKWMPVWAVVSKAADGLVEVYAPFAI